MVDKNQFKTSVGSKKWDLQHEINYRICKNDCRNHDENKILLPPIDERTFTVCPKERSKRVVKEICKLDPNFSEDFHRCFNHKKL